jgi:outer membrane protein insertion porin family
MVPFVIHGGEILKVFSITILIQGLFMTVAAWSAGSSPSPADTTLNGKPVAGVLIFGNERTKPEVILREMKIRKGDAFDEARVEEDRKRIQNLGIFNRVEMFTESAWDGVRIMILVTEGPTFLPYPVLHINERDWKKLSYGAGLRILNFRGRAETLDALFSAGYNPIYGVAYINPWIDGTQGLQAGFNATSQRLLSKHFRNEKAHENQDAFYASVGKRLTLHVTFGALLGVREVAVSPARIDPDGHPADRMPVAGLSVLWDHRDLREYPMKGFLLYLSARKNGWPSKRIDYNLLEADARGYLPILKTFTFALRASTAITTGAPPVYDRLFLGYEERIRGHWSETAEGENRWIAAFSLRWPLIPVRYFDLGEASEFMNLKFGVSAGIFADAGKVWLHSDKWNGGRVLFGYGAGLHFHLPIVDVLRLDAAFDEKGRREWIFDIGVDI